ncbi:MAG: RluA family pseudouridine synthase [Bdellovibrio sp.]
MGIIEKKFTRQVYEAIYEAEPQQHGMRLDQFVMLYLGGFSREQIKNKIKDGEIQIVGRPGKQRPNSTVHYRDQVIMKIHRTIHEDEYWNGEKIDIEVDPEIVFEDDDLIVISKPPYMTTHPTGKHLFYCATVHFENIHNKTIHSLHRLDRETSGILMLGKSPKASATITDHFENDRVRKCYFLIGIKNSDYKGLKHFTAKERLGGEDEGQRRVMIEAFPEDSDLGKSAETEFEILYEENQYVLALAFPKTGRQHQIRVHAQVHGFPLLGDKLYFGGYPMFQRFKDLLATEEDHVLMQIPRQALHAVAINLPYKGEQTTFICHLPHDLKDWIRKNLKIEINKLEEIVSKEIKNYFNSFSK